MIKISLIQTSQNKNKELMRFVSSLNQQQGIDFKEVQLIFVDQENNRIVFNELNKDVMFDYIQTSHCSLSHARNLALPLVKGEFIAFPDDDCWYETDTLACAMKVLEKEGYDGVSGKGTNEHGALISKFPRETSIITRTRRCAAMSITLFLKYNSKVYFDENIGVGSPYNLGSGEETDYMLTLIECYNYRIKYDPNIIVHHLCIADNTTRENTLKKAYYYARGGGYLMQKHHTPIGFLLKEFIRPIGGMIIYTLYGRFYNVKKSFFLLKGRLEGFFYKLPQ